MVNFFASWCVPCRAEHAYLTAFSEESGVPLYGINHRDKPEDAAAWLAELGNPYQRIGADPGRAAVEWGVTGVPETFVIDGAGRIRWHHRGPLVPQVIERDLKPLIAALQP
jgi:cytochrome c biogenesis protein CcmG/thiol:disulfide interchange protein DsbE